MTKKYHIHIDMLLSELFGHGGRLICSHLKTSVLREKIETMKLMGASAVGEPSNMVQKALDASDLYLQIDSFFLETHFR
jgi:hypothetical protein